jgi:hypothetical protein
LLLSVSDFGFRGAWSIRNLKDFELLQPNSVAILDTDVQISASGRDLIRGKISRGQRCPYPVGKRCTMALSDGVRNLPCGNSYNDAE